jgi:hypothetical protein
LSEQLDTLSKSSFRWKTIEGKILKLHEMETSHIFNSMKMIFNHLAEANGGKPVNFANKYSLYKILAKTEINKLAAQVMLFIEEIERRGDLPEQYKRAYANITYQIFYDKQENQKELKEKTKTNCHNQQLINKENTVF